MSVEPSEFLAVLRCYGFGLPAGGVSAAVGGGFSGANVWRVETTAGPCCLRRWPLEGPAVDRIRWIHSIVRHAHGNGCSFFPLPLLSAEHGETVIVRGGRAWELSDWREGRPDATPHLSGNRLRAVISAFAAFHTALVDEPWAGAVEEPSPGISDRNSRIDVGLRTGWSELRTAIVPPEWTELRGRRDEYLELFPRAAAIVRPMLAEAGRRRRRLQPCIRDIRREHVLFVGDRLTGVVDFGAMQMEHPAIDVARVVGEFIGDDEPGRTAALAEYRAAAPPQLAEAADPALVDAFDYATVVLAPQNWLRWILVQQRDFADRAAVLRRIDELISRLRRIVHENVKS